MTTGTQLVNRCIDLYENHQPQWYSQQDPRCDPLTTHHADCSGGICGVLGYVGVPPSYGCSNSWGMAQYGHAHNLGISRDEALHTPGAAFVIGANEGQTNIDNLGHIGLLLGDGHSTFEWRNHVVDVGIFDIASHYRIDYWMHLPGIDYTSPSPAPTPVPKRKQRNVSMIVLPNTKQTPLGRFATAIVDFRSNRVKLEDGGRLVGDKPSSTPREHYWEPAEKDQVPGWSNVDVAAGPTGLFSKYPKYLVVRYAWGDDNGGTYIAEVAK